MKLISHLANITAPSGGFSKGRLKDNPGDGSGTGITVQTHNDFLYAFYALIEKYRTGGMSDADESETASDVIDALEEMVGLKVNTVAEWAVGTTYSTLGTPVMRYGMQFVNILNTANIGKDPVLQPAYWMAVPKADALFDHFSRGRVLRAECAGVHDYNGAKYQQYFSLGVHRVGGVAGAVFNAWGVHLDGGTVTGGSALDTLLASYFLQTSFAPGTPKVLKDARETVDRAGGVTGGLAPTIGVRQEDQGHGHYHTVYAYGSSPYSGFGFAPSTGASSSQTTGGGGAWAAKDIVTDGTNGTPRVGTETRVKAFVTGVPYFVIMVAA
jgi:hypothetical protein